MDKIASYYDDVFSDEECVRIGEVLFDFENGAINYSELEDKIAELGFDIDPLFTDPSALFREKSDDGKSRVVYTGYYFLTTPEKRKILIGCDECMIAKLAKNGNEMASISLRKIFELS